jgi:hypothetical protein
VRRQRFVTLVQSVIVVGVSAAGVLGAAGNVMAQALKDVQTPDTPLVLKAQGSFFVGGEKVEQTQGELGDLGPGGHITVNQMYVRYMVPQGGDGNVPVVMVHGATLTGKSWETTPDGRMGWDEYFVRKGHAVYIPDQVGRGRSGFNQAIFNNARAGSAPASSRGCPPNYTDEQIKTLATLPILILFGDYRDTPTGLPTFPTWQARFEGCQALIGRIKNAGGQAEMLAPPERGIRGNSHMIMQDRNHLQIADLILKWIDERVAKPAGARK